ncbi:hypothetical protein FRC17_004126 [Serendipita sp. 399]|nr:hypothetical protein FRC17_004126 [Serendipita sp. 399]
MSSHQILLQQSRTPIVQRTRSQKTANSNFNQRKPHRRGVLQPVNNIHNNTTANNVDSITNPTVVPASAAAAASTFAIDHTLGSRMPPRLPSTLSRNPTRRNVSRTGKTVGAKARSASTSTNPSATTEATQSGSKRALSPPLIFDDSDIPYKRFKSDVGAGPSLLAEIDTTSNDGSLPPSSADVSMSTVSVSSEGMTISAESADEKGTRDEEPAPLSFPAPALTGEKTPARSRTPDVPMVARTPINAAHIELSKTPKAPWLSSSKLPTLKFTPMKKSAVKPLIRTPMRPSGDLKLPSAAPNLLAPTPKRTSNPSGATPADKQLTEYMAASNLDADPPEKDQVASSNTTQPALTSRPVPAKSRNQNVSAAFALPVSLSPIKTPARSFLAAKVGGASPVRPKISKPSILRRVGQPSTSLSSSGPPNGSNDAYKSPLSSTLAALMNRTTVDPHAATQAQLSTLNQALEQLDAPRPPSSMSQQQPNPRPSTSLGFGSGNKKGIKDARQTTGPRRPALARPGTSLGVASTSRGMNPPTSISKSIPSIGGGGRLPVAGLQRTQSATGVEARRASTASLALSQSLPAPPPKSGPGPKAPPPAYTTASGRRVVSAIARAAPLPSPDSKDKSQEDVQMVDASQPGTSSDGVNNQQSSPSKRAAPLDILKDCVIYVDVKTEDGEDAGSLFVDMLRGLGAKILTRMGGSLTHIVYKSGLPSTLTKYRTITDPKPPVVGIGWVVECVEKREKVDPSRYLISLEEEAGSVLEGLKSTKASGSTKAGGANKAQGKGVQTTLQFKPVAKKDTS